MTSFAEPIASRARDDAFRAAGRHTSRVRILRRSIVALVMVAVVAILALSFNPFGRSIPAVSVESMGLSGTKVTMDRPKLSGFHADGRPYTVLAKEAIQDAKTPNILELHEIDARVTMGDKSTAHVLAATGTYDSSAQTMKLKGDVHVTTDAGYDARMASAFVQFKTNSVETQDPVTVVMNADTVTADSMKMTDNGKAVTFSGHVHSVMMPQSTATATASTLKGTGP